MRYILLTLFLAGCLTAEEKPLPEPIIDFAPKQYVCYRTDKPLNIDGKMDEASWGEAAFTDYFVDIEGPSKPEPRYKTRAKMLWDDEFFYVFAEMEEPHVWAKLVQRDTVIFYDNDFEVFIDPDGDTHQYYELEINAYSTEWDLFLDKPYRDEARPLFFWDLRGMKSAVQVHGTINNPKDKDKGWNLEIAIPWEVMKEAANKPSPPEDGNQWRVGFSRVEWKTHYDNGRYEKVINPKTGRPFPEDNWVWSPQGVINMHYPELWGFVQFSNKVAGEGKSEFKFNPEENAKWALRQVYYRQKTHSAKHGTYSNDINKLGLSDYTVKGYIWPPKISTTVHTWEAILESEDKSESWVIIQDGKIWKK